MLQVQIVGREYELAELTDAVTGLSAGRGGVVMLLGEAGMGKSTLVDWAVARAAAEGVRVGRGGCSAAGVPPLWPLRRAVGDVVPTVGWVDAGRAPAAIDRELFVASVVEAVADTVRQGPLLLVVEDLHWADPLSLWVVRALADAVPGLALVLMLTVRDDSGEMSPEIRSQLGLFPTHARQISLAPLDAAAVATMAAQVRGAEPTEADVSALLTRTGGNPYFVHEVLRLQAAQGPSAALVVPLGVAEVLRRRVARVSQRCAAMLAVAAVAAETSGEVIEDDLGGDADPVTASAAGWAALLDEARSTGLVVQGASGWMFRHALVREVIAAGLPADERARLHAVVAQRLEQRARPSPARLAYHWSKAVADDATARAGYWALRAARDAMAQLAFESAAEHYRRAVGAPGVDTLAASIELGEALQLAGQLDPAREVLLAAAEDAQRAGRPVEVARAGLALGGGLAGFEVPTGDPAQSGVLRRADEMLPERELSVRAAVRGRLSLTLAGSVEAAERVAMALDAVRLARQSGDAHVEAAVLAAYCDAVAGPDYVAERVAAASRMATLASSMLPLRHEQVGVLLARRLLLVAYLESGDLAAAEAQASAYEQVAARLGIALYGWLPQVWRGMRALLAGDVDAALGYADGAERIGQRAGSLNAELMVFTLRMQAHLDRGTPERYADTVREVMDRLTPLGLPVMYHAAPARVLLAAGDAGPARSVLRALRSGDAAVMPKDAEWLEAHWAMVDMAIELDDRAAAGVLSQSLAPYRGLWAVDGVGGAVFGAVAEQLARLAEYEGRPADAAHHRTAALDGYRQQDTPALARRLLGSGDASVGAARIHREGATWQLDWAGRRSSVPDAKGLRDLAALLTHPGQPVPALRLLQAAGGPTAQEVGGTLGPVLDDAAMRAYRRRLQQLDADLADAGPVHAEQIREERSMLIDQLAGAVGLGGRSRVAGDPAERARKAVTMRIRTAIRTIEGQDPALARHLSNSVRTGRLCSYEPETPVQWRT